MFKQELDLSCITTIRTRAKDAVQAINSATQACYVRTTGHGIAMRSFRVSAPLKDLQNRFMFESAR